MPTTTARTDRCPAPPRVPVTEWAMCSPRSVVPLDRRVLRLVWRRWTPERPELLVRARPR
jgi:hypothetical protein